MTKLDENFLENERKGKEMIPLHDTKVICLRGHGDANKSPNPTT